MTISSLEEQEVKLPEPPEPHRDPYRSVVLVLLAAAAVGTVGAVAGGLRIGNPVLLAIAVTLGLACGALTGVAVAQRMRARPGSKSETPSIPAPEEKPVTMPEGPAEAAGNLRLRLAVAMLRSRLDVFTREAAQWLRDRGVLRMIRLGTGALGAIAIGLVLLMFDSSPYPLDPLEAGIAAAACLLGAGIAAIAVRYLGNIEPSQFPESPSLRRGGRSIAWILVLGAISMGLAWAGQHTMVRVVYFVVLGLDAAFCYGLLTIKSPDQSTAFPLDVGVVSALGSRTNVFGSILDAAERQLGIDLRSTWALSVIRRNIEPLVLGLCMIAWLSTSLSVIGLEEQGLVERLGVPVGGPPQMAGIHVHWPWPVDRVFRIPVRRVQVLEVGHEGAEAPGPEDVLWAVEHAANEFTLVLGNGRDLITVDAGVQFRIVDAAAWRYQCQNPAQALSAIAYRAVMRNTVNLTLSDALSQNVALLTARMRGMIQSEADELGLGVEILGFTVGGMHPPVNVARDYQAVVSAEVVKVTTVVNAQVYRARILPEAEASSAAGMNQAHADGAEALGKAAGEAWSFRTLEAQYLAAPDLYFYRRRLEALEKGLAARDFTILDSRFQRDGGELWVMP